MLRVAGICQFIWCRGDSKAHADWLKGLLFRFILCYYCLFMTQKSRWNHQICDCDRLWPCYFELITRNLRNEHLRAYFRPLAVSYTIKNVGSCFFCEHSGNIDDSEKKKIPRLTAQDLPSWGECEVACMISLWTMQSTFLAAGRI